MKDFEMSAEIELSVVIPSYNEEKKIAKDLEMARTYLDTRPAAYEILVVDDGSADRTADVAEEIAGGFRQIRVLRQPENRGKGAAVRAGMRAARGKFALFADAGTCVPYDHIERGLAILSDGADLAIGSRAIRESHVLKKQPAYRRFGSRVFHLIVEYGIHLKDISDTQCGFKLFTRKAYRDIFHNLATDGFMFDIELLLYAQFCGYTIRSFPVEWSNDPDTRFKPVGGSIRNFKELAGIMWRMRKLRQGKIKIQMPGDE